ncbi:probable uracil-DNA glycosylase [Rhynchosporium agropyri]|uniref:Uracil-DNA glycosylase n=1 Tax=Rhynchosporium agropyri TaxID=914238 RepID=A0A1E1KLF1_9HELO|nr:probable uracil-DNA glycosylase [Rhynchosporium agropyri]
MSLKRKAGDTPTSSDSKKPKVDASITSFFGAPKPKPSNGTSSTSRPSPPPVNFDKDKWVASLNEETKELLRLEIETLHESWLKELKDEVTSKSFLDLKRFLKRERESGKKIFPKEEDVYSWSRHTPFPSVRAVILGQDPYHNDNQAHGLSFSVQAPTPAPPSLKNIYKALAIDYPSFVPPPGNSGLLTPWAQRGVLLLNTCLTVRAHEANSHSNRGWEKFTQRVIDLVAEKRRKGVVFLAWGAPAAKRVKMVDKVRHLVLLSVHPSPLSASRGWFQCGHFRKTNDWLVNKGQGKIDWSLGPKSLFEGETKLDAGEELQVKEGMEEKVVQKVVEKKIEKSAEDEFEDEEAEAAMNEAFEAEQKEVESVKVEEIKPVKEV